MDIFYPIEFLANYLVGSIFMVSDPHLFDALSFFIYDTLKIFILILLITHLMTWLQYYLPIEKLRNFLSSRNFYGLDYFLASAFGVITPFCSCSSIPLFMGFLQGGIPLGVTLSFLITSPLINEVAIGLFIGLFGLRITLIYILSGVLIGVLGGFVMSRMKMEKYVADFIWQIKSTEAALPEKKKRTKKEIFKIISQEAFCIIKKIYLYILLGVGVGAFVHGYVPEGFFEVYLAKAGIFGVPLAVILAVPLYSNASGVIPVVQSLIAKGVPLGTGLAFMMAVVGISLPEAMILKRVMKMPLLLSFFGVVTLGIIIIGYLFNIIL